MHVVNQSETVCPKYRIIRNATKYSFFLENKVSYKANNVFSGSVVLPTCYLNSVNDFSFC